VRGERRRDCRRARLREGEWSLAYQSRFGKERWLQPYTADTLDALAERGIRTIDVACPGFAADCLETLEEIAIGLRARVSTHGGTLRYIPCLNDDADHAAALAAWPSAASAPERQPLFALQEPLLPTDSQDQGRKDVGRTPGTAEHGTFDSRGTWWTFFRTTR
jgi:hypothetical protein